MRLFFKSCDQAKLEIIKLTEGNLNTRLPTNVETIELSAQNLFRLNFYIQGFRIFILS